MRWLVLIALSGGCFIKPDPPPGGSMGDDDDGGGVPRRLAAGENHACFIDASTELWCWGLDDDGQLGISPREMSPTGKAHSLGTGWTDVAAGGDQTCGIQASILKCWGNGEATGSDTPRQVVLGATTPVHVVVGNGAGVCAFDASGNATCIGDLDLMTSYAVPTSLSVGGRNGPWTTIAFGVDHTCVIDATTLELLCWGMNSNGQLAGGASGADVTIDHAVTASYQNNEFLDVTAVYGTTCAITTAHEVVCVGNGEFASDSPMLAAVATAPTTWTQDAIDGNHSCLIGGGDVYCYGYDDNGSLGDGFVAHGVLATPIASVSHAIDVVTGGQFSCATDGTTVGCWGGNQYGQLGNGAVSGATSPTEVTVATGPYASITTGANHTCVIAGSGTPYCWGDNRDHQAAPTNGAPILMPTEATATVMMMLAAGGHHTCGLGNDHSIYCWGTNGLSGAGPMSILSGATLQWLEVAASDDTSCGLDASNTVSCWGELPWSSITNPTVTPSPMTSGIVTASSLVAVGTNRLAALESSSGAVTAGTLCGADDSTPINVVASGVQIASAQGETSLGIPSGHTCVVTTTEMALTCWGPNDSNQISPSSTTCFDGTHPSSVSAPMGDLWLDGAGALSLAGRHSCALTGSNLLYCWGANVNGELGILAYNTPVPAMVNSMTWQEISTGVHHTCGISADGMHVYCWGMNELGEVGLAETFHDTPVDVVFQ